MPSSNAMENDKKRLRNQFTKDERSRLLAIMTEYGPLLDDKNISILSRKEIWEIIENKFNEHGHSGRTSAQLKKYWQNYKYHSKRAKIIQKEVPKTLSPITKQMVRMLAKVNPEDWARYDVKAGATPPKPTPESSRASSTALANVGPPFATDSNIAASESGTGSSTPVSRNPTSTPRKSLKFSASGASSSAGDSRARQGGGEVRSQTAERNVVVATTDVPGSSVTVSVICPEVQSKVRSIFWKRNATPDNVDAKLRSGYGDEGRNSPDPCFRPEFGNLDFSCNAKADKKNISPRSRKFVRGNDGSRSTAVGDARRGLGLAGMFAGDKPEQSAVRVAGDSDKRCGGYRQVPAMDDRLIRCVAVPRRRFDKNQSSINITEATTSRENQSNFIGNVPGVVKEMPRATSRLSRGCDSVETFQRSHSMINGENEMTKVSTGGGGGDGDGDDGVPKRSRSSPMSSRENRVAKDVGDGSGDADYARFDEALARFSIAESFGRVEILDDVKEVLETVKAAGESPPLDKDEKVGADLTRYAKSRATLSSMQDLSWLKLCLGLLRDLAQPRGSRHLGAVPKFGTLISTANLAEEGSTDSDRVDGEPGTEVEAGGDSGTGGAGGPRVGDDQVRRGIKVETEEGREEIGDPQAEDPVHVIFRDDRVMDSMDRLMRAKLRCARSEMDHRLKLQELETAEKELRVKIAEMTVQEAKLRIQALVEERLRAKEIHELRLAQISAESGRSEAEHAARLGASSVAAAESRSRFSSVERDRERSENFYQMQLRYMSGSVAPETGSVKCKRCQH